MIMESYTNGGFGSSRLTGAIAQEKGSVEFGDAA